jgi:uncharacterized damage-inducible protein DinB
MQLSDVQLMFEYNYWANELILAKASELTHEQRTQPNNYPFGSLHGTLVHLLDSENLWLNVLQQGIILEKRFYQTHDLSTIDHIRHYWQSEKQAMLNYVNSFTDADMQSIVRYTVPEGNRVRVLWHCFYHLINHGTQHRSECAQMLTDFGNSPGDLDFTLFLNIKAGIE